MKISTLYQRKPITVFKLSISIEKLYRRFKLTAQSNQTQNELYLNLNQTKTGCLKTHTPSKNLLKLNPKDIDNRNSGIIGSNPGQGRFEDFRANTFELIEK